MRVTMIGAGYVGLVSGACFADFGHVVTCVDKDPGKIDRLKDGVMPIFEPGLAELVENNVNEGRLFFTLDAADAIKNADAIFIAVGTPLPPRRWPCRPLLCLCRRERDRRAHGRLHRRRHQVDRSGGHRG